MTPTDIKLNDAEEFDKRFIEHTADSATYEEAYLKTEADYRKVFKSHKYSSYNSYRVSRRKRLKKMASQKV